MPTEFKFDDLDLREQPAGSAGAQDTLASYSCQTVPCTQTDPSYCCTLK
jgi:hypothetical protein